MKTVDIKRDNEGQVLHIPEQFAIDDDKVYIKKTGNVISIIPYHDAWRNLHESLHLFTNDFMESRDQPGQQNRESLD